MKEEQQVPENDGRIPESVLDQLNEHCVGGFIVFYFNSEHGHPEEAVTFDSPAHCLALQKHILDWGRAIDSLGVESQKMEFMAGMEPPDDDKEEFKEA